MNKIVKFLIAASITFATFSAPSAMSQERSAEEIKQLALEAIVDNPEIIRQAIDILRAKDQQAKEDAAKSILKDNKALLERDDNAPILGNPDGDVTVVEFFDYNCPYCKTAAPMVKAAIASDAQLRVVYREWPILSDGSVIAARAALAARVQGKYEDFHWELMKIRNKIDESVVFKAAEKVGLDIGQLKSDMKSPSIDEHIQKSMQLAQALNFSGTPSFVIGNNMAPGLISPEQFQAMIDGARINNGKNNDNN